MYIYIYTYILSAYFFPASPISRSIHPREDAAGFRRVLPTTWQELPAPQGHTEKNITTKPTKDIYGMNERCSRFFPLQQRRIMECFREMERVYCCTLSIFVNGKTYSCWLIVLLDLEHFFFFFFLWIFDRPFCGLFLFEFVIKFNAVKRY